jgi:hypothetical protein
MQYGLLFGLLRVKVNECDLYYLFNYLSIHLNFKFQ